MRAHTNGPLQENNQQRDHGLPRCAADLDVALSRARARLHEAQRAVHDAGQVLAIARIERHVAAMEVADLADRLERLQSQLERSDAVPLIVMPDTVVAAVRAGARPGVS